MSLCSFCYEAATTHVDDPCDVMPACAKCAAAWELDPGFLNARKSAKVVGYRSGSCRNEERALSHTYAMMSDGELWPMCGYGWNRSDGERFSILRSSPGTEGDCKLCRKNVADGKPPVFDGFPHKTRWL